jgi:predicted DCC family thiol-disulfide oxidoreductase YuxK
MMNEPVTSKAIILFDGVCNFCNSSVNFVMKHDKKDRFRFAPLQSDTGKKILQQFHEDTDATDSVILIENSGLYKRSTAILRIAKRLGGAYVLLYGFMIVPRFLRDAVYNFIGRNRYKWFGKKDSCMIPTEEVKKKFIG